MGLILKDVSKTFAGKKVVDNISISLSSPTYIYPSFASYLPSLKK